MCFFYILQHNSTFWNISEPVRLDISLITNIWIWMHQPIYMYGYIHTEMFICTRMHVNVCAMMLLWQDNFIMISEKIVKEMCWKNNVNVDLNVNFPWFVVTWLRYTCILLLLLYLLFGMSVCLFVCVFGHMTGVEWLNKSEAKLWLFILLGNLNRKHLTFWEGIIKFGKKWGFLEEITAFWDIIRRQEEYNCYTKNFGILSVNI